MMQDTILFTKAMHEAYWAAASPRLSREQFPEAVFRAIHAAGYGDAAVQITPAMVAAYWEAAKRPLSDAAFPEAVYRAMRQALEPAVAAVATPHGSAPERATHEVLLEQLRRPWNGAVYPQANEIQRLYTLCRKAADVFERALAQNAGPQAAVEGTPTRGMRP